MYDILQDIGGRPYMEDTVLINENFVNDIKLYCVFDGHGGDFVAKYMMNKYSNILLEKIRENLGTIPDMMFQSIKEVILQIPKDDSMTCGTTYLIVLKYGELLFVANGGDCRAIINDDVNVKQITIDHKPNLKREYDRIYASGGFVTFNENDVPRVNGNLAISKSIGDFYLYPHVTWIPDIFMTQISKNNHLLVIASDGLWDVMSNEDVMNIYINNIRNNDNKITKAIIQNSSQECLRMARERGSTDNFTLLVTTI